MIWIFKPLMMLLQTPGDDDVGPDVNYTHTQRETYSVSQKIPPKVLWYFPQTLGEFWVKLLRAYCTFLSTLDYKFLFNYLQPKRSYGILSVTIQFTPYAQNVHYWPKRTLAFSENFPKWLGIFSPNFTCLLHIPIYTRLQNFIQLSQTVRKLCHGLCTVS